MARSTLARACLIALSGLATVLPAMALASADANSDALAQRLVTAAAVKEGEVVAINGQARSAQLMEDIAVAVRRVGGFPLVMYSSDRLSKRLFFDVPASYDGQPNTAGLKLAELVDVNFNIEDGQSEGLFEGADARRLAERTRANEPVAKALLANNVRRVDVGNGFYPTPWRAQRYGMPEAELAQVFWQGLAIDPATLQARAEVVSAALAAGDALHVTHPNGTDFTVSLKGRRILSADGAVSAEELAQGGAAVSIYLPAGEVYTTPVPGSANGRIVISHDFFRGKPIQNLSLQFKDGRLVSMSGSGAGYADFRASHDAIKDPRKDEFSYIDLGINPNATLPAGSQIGAWISAGTISLGTGTNSWAGGDNQVGSEIAAILTGTTVRLDGKTIIDKGVLKL